MHVACVGSPSPWAGQGGVALCSPKNYLVAVQQHWDVGGDCVERRSGREVRLDLPSACCGGRCLGQRVHRGQCVVGGDVGVGRGLRPWPRHRDP